MNEGNGFGTDPPASRSGRVRIVGAEKAGHRDEQEEPEVPESDDYVEAALPHWTEPPTGEVPAILHRGTDDEGSDSDPWSSISGPTWREEHRDWEDSGEVFEPAMLANDEARLGSLDDSGETDRQPWTFSLEGQGDEVGRGWEDAQAEAAIVANDLDATMIVPLSSSLEETGARTDEPEDFGPRARRVPLPPPPDLGDVEVPVVEQTQFVVAPEDLVPGDAPGLRRLTAPPPGEPRRQRTVDERPLAPSPRPRVPRREPTNGNRAPRPAPTDLPLRDSRSGRNMPVAIASGLALGIAMLLLFKLGTVAAMVIVVAVVVLGAAEGYAAFRHAGYQPATLFGLVACVSVMIGTYNKGQAALPLVLIMLFAFTLLWYMVGVERGADPVRGTAATLLVFCWVGAFGSYAALLLSPSMFPNRHGIAFLLGGVICAVAYDCGALAIGAWIGRRPLAPGISPSKTLEGALGGAVCAVLAAVVVVHFVHPWTLGKAALLGVIVAVVAPLGDLCESLIKRHLGLKDMSSMLPGHGGFLDRIDGLLFVLPATFYLVKAVHLG